jgi:integrase
LSRPVNTGKRRPKGEGGLRYRESKKLWVAEIDIGLDAAGKRIRRTLYAKTRPELLRRISDLKARGGGSIRPRAAGTLAEFMESWLEHDVKPNKRSATYEAYENAWRVHAGPIVGRLKMEKFDVANVAALYAALRSQGRSTNTLNHVARVMHTAFGVAVKRRRYTRPNPFSLIDRPSHTAREGHALTIDEARRFIVAARDDRFEALWLLCLMAGLRIGEALGIYWTDIDFDRGTIAIQRAVSDVFGKPTLGPLKTKKSRRLVEIGPVTREALLRRLAAHDAEGHSSKLVFPESGGGPHHRRNLTRRHFAPILAAAGVDRIRIHDLRYSMTSFGVAAGVDAKVLADRLGHSTTRLTQDRYSHVLPGLDRGAADAIERLLG